MPLSLIAIGVQVSPGNPVAGGGTFVKSPCMSMTYADDHRVQS